MNVSFNPNTDLDWWATGLMITVIVLTSLVLPILLAVWGSRRRPSPVLKIIIRISRFLVKFRFLFIIPAIGLAVWKNWWFLFWLGTRSIQVVLGAIIALIILLFSGGAVVNSANRSDHVVEEHLNPKLHAGLVPTDARIAFVDPESGQVEFSRDASTMAPDGWYRVEDPGGGGLFANGRYDTHWDPEHPIFI
jgi:hypothetical protein